MPRAVGGCRRAGARGPGRASRAWRSRKPARNSPSRYTPERSSPVPSCGWTCRARARRPGDLPPRGCSIARIPLVPVRDGAAWSGLIGVDLETAPGTYPVQITAESADARPLAATHLLAVSARRFPTRRLRVAPVYVEPPAAEVERIAADAARLDALFKTTTGQSFPGRFEAPVAAVPQDTFGARSIYNGQSRSPHAGVDFRAPSGTPIGFSGSGRRRVGRRSLLHRPDGRIGPRARVDFRPRPLVENRRACRRRRKAGRCRGRSRRDRPCHRTAPALERAPQWSASRPDVAHDSPGRRTLTQRRCLTSAPRSEAPSSRSRMPSPRQGAGRRLCQALRRTRCRHQSGWA